MSKWATVGDAKASGDKLPNLPAGRYAVEITKCKDVEGRSGDLFFIVELKIQESDNSAVSVGAAYSQVIKFNNDMGPINVKRFILAANGFDPNDAANDDEVGEDEVEFVLSEEQPLAGLVMDLQCDMIKTKAGKDFTKHTWFAVEDAD